MYGLFYFTKSFAFRLDQLQYPGESEHFCAPSPCFSECEMAVHIYSTKMENSDVVGQFMMEWMEESENFDTIYVLYVDLSLFLW